MSDCVITTLHRRSCCAHLGEAAHGDDTTQRQADRGEREPTQLKWHLRTHGLRPLLRLEQRRQAPKSHSASMAACRHCNMMRFERQVAPLPSDQKLNVLLFSLVFVESASTGLHRHSSAVMSTGSIWTHLSWRKAGACLATVRAFSPVREGAWGLPSVLTKASPACRSTKPTIPASTKERMID